MKRLTVILEDPEDRKLDWYATGLSRFGIRVERASLEVSEAEGGGAEYFPSPPAPIPEFQSLPKSE